MYIRKMIGYIYKLVDKRNNKHIYIGSTTWPLGKRLAGHKTDVRRKKEGKKLRVKINKIGMNNLDIILLQTLHNTTKERLKKRERYWINKLDTFDQGNTFEPIKK